MKSPPGLRLFIATVVAITLSHPTMAQEEHIQLDTPTIVNGVDVVCTGVGITARENPDWAAYSLKVEVAGSAGQYLGNVRVLVERDNEGILELVCGGPWILARLEPGTYAVTATFEGASATGGVNVPATGQAWLVLRFPEAGGGVSPEHTPSPG